MRERGAGSAQMTRVTCNAHSAIRNRQSAIKKCPRTRRRTLTQNGHAVAGSGQALLQHTRISTYGCFLPDLTGFGGIPLSRTQPSTSRVSHLTKEQSALGREFDLAKADCEYRTPLVSRLARVKSESRKKSRFSRYHTPPNTVNLAVGELSRAEATAKSSTYKLALLRILLGIGDGAKGIVLEKDDDHVSLPFGLVPECAFYRPLSFFKDSRKQIGSQLEDLSFSAVPFAEVIYVAGITKSLCHPRCNCHGTGGRFGLTGERRSMMKTNRLRDEVRQAPG